MPIYEYVCPACKTKFEMLRPLSEADKDATCPECRKPARRKLSTFACFSSNAGAMRRLPGTGSSGGACSSCSSGNCSTCGD